MPHLDRRQPASDLVSGATRGQAGGPGNIDAGVILPPQTSTARSSLPPLPSPAARHCPPIPWRIGAAFPGPNLDLPPLTAGARAVPGLEGNRPASVAFPSTGPYVTNVARSTTVAGRNAPADGCVLCGLGCWWLHSATSEWPARGLIWTKKVAAGALAFTSTRLLKRAPRPTEGGGCAGDNVAGRVAMGRYGPVSQGRAPSKVVSVGLWRFARATVKPG